MIQIKKEVVSEIRKVLPDIVNGYPSDWKKDVVVSYLEESNVPDVIADGSVHISSFTYKFDIWVDNGSTTETSEKIDSVMFGKFGFTCTTNTELNESSTRRHRIMRYEAKVDIYGNVYSPYSY